jgi:hypothetical protein
MEVSNNCSRLGEVPLQSYPGCVEVDTFVCECHDLPENIITSRVVVWHEGFGVGNQKADDQVTLLLLLPRDVFLYQPGTPCSEISIALLSLSSKSIEFSTLAEFFRSNKKWR